MRDFLRVDIEDATDTAINAYIVDAETDIFLTYGRHQEDRYIEENSDQAVRDLVLRPINTVVDIRVNTDDNELTETTDYTVDTTVGQITFVEDVLDEGDFVKISYIPELYKTLTKYKAAWYTVGAGLVMSGDGGGAAPTAQFINDLIDKMEKQLRQKVNIRHFNTNRRAGGWPWNVS